MPVELTRQAAPKNRLPIDIHQDSFPDGYISTIANSRRPRTSLSDLTNMEIVQDNVPQPRPPLVRYGTQPTHTVIGRGSYRYNGVRGQLFMMNVSGAGTVYYQTDGGSFTQVTGATYSVTPLWAGFRQTTNRVYIFNGVDNLSYIDLTTMTITTYTSLTQPAAPSGTASTNLASGTKPYNYYYAVTAINNVGESQASTASSAINVNDIRDNWSANSSIAKTVTVTWTAVSGATAYTIYGGDSPTTLYEIITFTNLTSLSFTDDGSQTLNPYKTAPQSNATQGQVFNWMYVDKTDAQTYGVTSDNKLYYSAAGTGDFSPLNGGGYITIDQGGDTQLNFVDGFRTGKGDPVITTSSRGAAGKGRIDHLTPDSATFGSQTIFFFDVIEANGQSGTYAPRATVKAGDNIYYPTGTDFETTGTSQNVVNILTNLSIGQDIIPDIEQINLLSLQNASGVEYQNKVYFALPVNSTTNNQIWYKDLTRKGLWVLRWNVAATDIWLYEDNSGLAHLCILRSDNLILEFTRIGSTPTTDDGVAFSTRCAFSSLVWDADGITLGNVQDQYYKFLQPQGNIMVNTYGLTKRGSVTNSGTANYSVDVTYTGIGAWDYSGNYQYGQDIGTVTTFGNSLAVLHTRPKGLLNQLDYEIITSTAGCDYILSSVRTTGFYNNNLIYQGIS